MSIADQTSDEARVAERYLAVLSDLSMCMEAVRDGDWRNLTQAAEDLCRRAALLAEVAGKLQHDDPAPRGHVVTATVVAGNNSSRAAQLLYPAAAAATIAKTAMTDPFTHPNAARPDR